MNRPEVHGFTLIELLVVIAIIALLVTILMPTLNQAKELARRSVCLSNQRNLALSVHSYALEYSGLPIGHYGPGDGQHKWSNYLINWGNTEGGYMLLGKLWQTELVQNGRMFYCPSQRDSSDPRLLYDTEYNTWPPLEGQTFCRAGYGTRPSVAWPHFFWNYAGIPKLPDDLPADQAMLSDYTFGWASVEDCHVDGVNVVSVGGAGRWVALDRISDTLDQLPASPLVNVGTAYDDFYLNESETSGLWADFDG